jgi:hypothetical protein
MHVNIYTCMYMYEYIHLYVYVYIYVCAYFLILLSYCKMYLNRGFKLVDSCSVNFTPPFIFPLYFGENSRNTKIS